MHSRIFQLGLEPITVDDYLDEGTLIEDTRMLDGVADYFNEDTDRADDISWLVSCLNNKGLDIKHTVEEIPLECVKGAYVKVDKLTFSFESLATYIENKMNDVQTALDEVFNINLDKNEDSREFNYKLYCLKSAIDEKFGFYVWDENNGYYYSIDDFLYDLVEPYRKKDVYTFYVGATIDYHS